MDSPADLGVATAPDTLRFERLLPGPIERVWSYLADSDKRGQWLAAGVMPPQAGAGFEMRFAHKTLSDEAAPIPERFRHLEGGHTSHHRVLSWEPPHRLALSWSDGAGGESEVTFELSPRGDDVRLMLTHRRLANRQVLRNVAKGWHSHLAILSDRLNGRAPKAFWALMESVEQAYDQRIEA